MKYIKTKISIVPNEEWFRDVLTAQLGQIGFESFMESEDGLEAFIPEKDFYEVSFSEVLAEQPSSVKIRWDKEIIEDKNWNEEWEKNYFQPLLIGGECVVRAPFHKTFPKAKYEIIIEPNMAFGTGNHETTSLMTQIILTENFKGKKVLDMGCGTGILGILASMRGAEKIMAVDISEWAVSGTKENAALNNINNISVILGDATSPGKEKYDYIFANIHKNVLLVDMKTYTENLNSGSKIFLSGFYLEDLKDIQVEAEKRSLRYQSHRVLNNWVVLIMQNL